MSTLKDLFNRFPNLIAWIVLAAGMVGIIVYEAQDVGLQGMQWFWLVVITMAVAALCIWIISWEDGEDESDPSSES